MLLAGTDDGVYRTAGPRFESARRVLDAGRTMRIRRFDGWDGVFAATKSGLYRSTDGGDSWIDLGVPREEVYSVLGDPAGERLYAGTHPAHLYVSADDGGSWTELAGLQDLPSREEWYTPRHRDEAHVRSLGAHPDAPDRLVAGVEVGGVHVSDDRGETWTERRDGLQDDVHHVLVRGPDEYVASCGGGLYRTRDAGESWTRLDRDLDHTYFREAFEADGVLYAAAARSSPGTWQGSSGADAALFESRTEPPEFEALAYPGRPEEVVLAWAARDGEVLAATNRGRIIVRELDGWVQGGTLPAGVRSLCPV
ncbi:WD40/YVTN/BNR-like repeat-containing protein [Halorussus marinus]|uniref:WD40/YVTN/BNR-like repeat-containing protein n=1 Tax=Halorussus marinus TaxID=2505976 RepID=UPI00106E9670|nr:glycosyl hydrolase [Halorussus marinus]